MRNDEQMRYTHYASSDVPENDGQRKSYDVSYALGEVQKEKKVS
jgi:hypothetical protein